MGTQERTRLNRINDLPATQSTLGWLPSKAKALMWCSSHLRVIETVRKRSAPNLHNQPAVKQIHSSQAEELLSVGTFHAFNRVGFGKSQSKLESSFAYADLATKRVCLLCAMREHSLPPPSLQPYQNVPFGHLCCSFPAFLQLFHL